VRLGASKASVFAALGRPDDGADQNGAAVWRYRAKGLSFAINDATGVQLIWTTAPGEALDGVRVGDPMSTAQARWGVGRRFGDFVRFERDGWVASIRVPQSTIREIAAVPR
jgi:hypothetical protein